MTRAREIKEHIRQLEEIPTLPGFFNRILETIGNERSSVRDLVAIISQDQALASKILKLANSAYYGRFRGVSTIEQAVTLIGFNEVKSASLSIGLFGSFSVKLLQEVFQTFWIHALGCATATTAIGDRGQEISQEKLYVGALLHDIGKLVFNLLFDGDYLEVFDLAAREGCAIHEAEKKIFSVHHAQVGEWLAERWHFPNELIELIGNHHHPFRSGLPRPKAIATIFLANYISKQARTQEETDAPSDPLLGQVLTTLNMSGDEIRRLGQEVKEQEGKIEEIISIIS